MDPITLAARVARDLAELHDGGFISEARVQDTLEGLPVRGKANWAWVAQDSEELTLAEDEEIVVLKREGEWWFGQNAAGQTGTFPHNYVLVLPYPPVAAPGPPPIPMRKPSTASTVSSGGSVYSVPPSSSRGSVSSAVPSAPPRRPSGYSDRDFAAEPLNHAYKPTLMDRAGGAVKTNVIGRLPGQKNRS